MQHTWSKDIWVQYLQISYCDNTVQTSKHGVEFGYTPRARIYYRSRAIAASPAVPVFMKICLHSAKNSSALTPTRAVLVDPAGCTVLQHMLTLALAVKARPDKSMLLWAGPVNSIISCFTHSHFKQLADMLGKLHCQLHKIKLAWHFINTTTNESLDSLIIRTKRRTLRFHAICLCLLD